MTQITLSNDTQSIKLYQKEQSIKLSQKDQRITLRTSNHSLNLTQPTHKLTLTQTRQDITLRQIGMRGLQGVPGNDGADGAAATITVGLTTTGEPETDAEVENVGTSSAAILNFTIPEGKQGIPGPAGADGDKNFVQEFTNSDSVLVNHNLNKYPSVTVINSANDEVVGELEYININSLLVTFIGSFSGKITCN